MGITRAQHDALTRPLSAGRIAKRSQGGKQLSYLESWDVRAHLIRLFGYGNFDLEVMEYHHVTDRPYVNGEKDMVEVIYSAHVRLTIRGAGDPMGFICSYSECAVGSASGPATMLGDHHDNALKTAVSDAVKRCAINLGTQFGLSLYDNGNTNDVVRKWLVIPDGEAVEEPPADLTPEQAEALTRSLGGKVIEEPNTDHTETVQA